MNDFMSFDTNYLEAGIASSSIEIDYYTAEALKHEDVDGELAQTMLEEYETDFKAADASLYCNQTEPSDFECIR